MNFMWLDCKIFIYFHDEYYCHLLIGNFSCPLHAPKECNKFNSFVTNIDLIAVLAWKMPESGKNRSKQHCLNYFILVLIALGHWFLGISFPSVTIFLPLILFSTVLTSFNWTFHNFALCDYDLWCMSNHLSQQNAVRPLAHSASYEFLFLNKYSIWSNNFWKILTSKK